VNSAAKNSLVRKGSAASVALLIVFLTAWQWGPGLLGIPSFIVPPLSMVYDEFFRMLHVNHLMTHTAITATEVLAGFVIGSLLGAFIGYVLGMSPTAEFALSPYILALQIAPKVAFAPLFIMWMGFTVYPKILVAILIVFFPIMVNVLSAIRTVDPDLINLARAFKATRAQIFWKIEFPASMPPLFAGLRIGSTLAVVGVVVGELVGGNMGLGYLLSFGEGEANTPMVFVTILMLTLVGAVAYLAVIVIEQRVLHCLRARFGGLARYRCLREPFLYHQGKSFSEGLSKWRPLLASGFDLWSNLDECIGVFIPMEKSLTSSLKEFSVRHGFMLDTSQIKSPGDFSRRG
jgi:NitT/TauT family transport system permease protein